MNNIKSAGWLFCLLIILAYSSYYFALSPVFVRLDDQALSTMPDTIVHDLKVSQYDETGKLANQLITPLLKHIPYQNSHWLKSPDIIVSQNNHPDWHIRAEQALAVHAGQKITFRSHVVIDQRDPATQTAHTFRTEELIYFPKQKFALSHVAVLFEQPGSVVQSQGMKAWLAEKHVKLLSKTNATYQPPHKA